MEKPRRHALKDSIRVASKLIWHPNGGSADSVGTANNLTFQPWFEALRRFGNSACDIIIGMMRYVQQSVVVVVQGHSVKCVDRFDNGLRLFWRIETLVAEHVGRYRTSEASMIGILFRLSIRYRVTSLWRRSFATVTARWAQSERRVSKILSCDSESDNISVDLVGRAGGCPDKSDCRQLS